MTTETKTGNALATFANYLQKKELNKVAELISKISNREDISEFIQQEEVVKQLMQNDDINEEIEELAVSNTNHINNLAGYKKLFYNIAYELGFDDDTMEDMIDDDNILNGYTEQYIAYQMVNTVN